MTKKRSKATPEGAVLRACLAFLRAHGIYAWRNNTTGIYDPTKGIFRRLSGLAGVSDILGVLPPQGRVLAVECKSSTGRVSPEQERFLATVTRLGGLAVVVRCVADLQEALRKEGVI